MRNKNSKKMNSYQKLKKKNEDLLNDIKILMTEKNNTHKYMEVYFRYDMLFKLHESFATGGEVIGDGIAVRLRDF